jgi:hypothetical protein
MNAKHRALLMLAVVSFVLPMGEFVIFKRPAAPMSGYMLAEAVLTAYAIYWWYVLDKREGKFRAGTFQNIGVAVFALVGLPVYFIRSRGWGRGSVAIGVSLCVLICVMLLAYLGELAGRAIAL